MTGKPLNLLVPRAGIEPARVLPRQILSLVRLPVSPSRLQLRHYRRLFRPTLALFAEMTQSSPIKRFICAGSLNVDITFQVPRMPEEHEKLRVDESIVSCGGSAANTAHWLARLGADVRMLGCVGTDAFGCLCVDALARVGVDVGLVQRSARSATGIAAIFVNPSSKRMVTTGGANGCFNPQVLPGDLFQPGVHLHVATSSLPMALSLLRMAKAGGASTSCDLDGLPGPELISHADVCFANQTDLFRALGQIEPGDAWRRLGGPGLALTRGTEGASFVDASGEYFTRALDVEVVDRTGGGDAFDAGFLLGWSQGLDWPSCLRSGLSLAAQVIAARGSRPERLGLG